MAATYWIKLYIEILHDPKMGMLPDHLWRRVVELFLLAGEQAAGGQLPDTGPIAWALRLAPDSLQAELEELAALNILRRNEAGWLVVHFAKRQAAASNTARSRYFRDRRRSLPPAEAGNAAATERCPESEAESESEEPEDPAGANDLARVTAEYCRNFGPVEPAVAELLASFLEDGQLARLAAAHDEPAAAWLLAAIREAALQQAGNPATYLRAILADWLARGDRSPQKKAGRPQGQARPKTGGQARPRPAPAGPPDPGRQARLGRLAQKLHQPKEPPDDSPGP